MSSNFTLVVATDKNGNIGKDNQLPWRLPSDLKWFKTVTSGGVVIMGRKTFESIGRPLPDRVNIVISRSPVPAMWLNDVIWVNSIEQAKLICRTHYESLAGRWFVIGGGEIYREFIPYADSVLLTEVDAEVSGDTQFPVLPELDWETIQGDFTYGVAAHPKDEYTYRRKLLKRKVMSSGRFKIFDSSETKVFNGVSVEDIERSLERFVGGFVRYGEYSSLMQRRVASAINPHAKLAAYCEVDMGSALVKYMNITTVTLADRVVMFADVGILRNDRLDLRIKFVPRASLLGHRVSFITVDIDCADLEISNEPNPT